MNATQFDAVSRLNDLTAEVKILQANVNVLFLFLSGTCVLFLQAGFAFLECGVVRTKNTTNILLITFCDLFFSGIGYFLVGWAFAKGEGNYFIGYHGFALVDVPEEQLCDWFYRCVIAALVATLVSGAVAERCNFTAHAFYSFCISGFIFPVVSHWAWSKDGWLHVGKDGYHYIDFAGSGVVHVVGGVCSFVASILIGPRIGRFDSVTGKPKDIRGHSLPISALGGFILICGFVSYNAGAQFRMSAAGDGGAVALIISNTVISGSFGCIVSLFIYKSGVCGNAKQWSFLPTLNGTIAAMVATCAAGDHYYQWGAALVGAGAAVVYYAIRTLVLRLQVDDPLDAVAVHFGGGAWGVITAVFFGKRNSLLVSDLPYKGYWLLWNIVGLGAIVAWSATCAFLLFGTMKKMQMLRVSTLVELSGLDLNKHGEPAYPVEGWEEEQYNAFEKDAGTFVNGNIANNNNNKHNVGILPVMRGSIKTNGETNGGFQVTCITSVPETAEL